MGTYDDDLAWLYARTRGHSPRDPRRMRAIMTALGLVDPPWSVHVVGTNGKGTVTTMLAEGLRASGLRSGRFLSPHVEDFRERIAVDGVQVSASAVRRYVAEAKGLERTEPALPAIAFFEHTLALALRTFAERGVEAAVLEAGVGGTKDATRAIEGVRLVVLTNVSLDHVATLGPTLADIAGEKAGAIRPGVPVVTGATGEALAVIERAAARLGSPLVRDSAGDPLFDPPAGSVQPEGSARHRNARLAAAALRVLGYGEDVVRAGLAAPALPARSERFDLGDREVLLDGAHDPAAAALLAAGLPPGFVLLFGALARKQGEATLAPLAASAARVILTEAHPGELPVPDPADRRFVIEPARALDAALEATPSGGLLVIAGSFHLAGALRPRLRGLARQATTPGLTRLPRRTAIVRSA